MPLHYQIQRFGCGRAIGLTTPLKFRGKGTQNDGTFDQITQLTYISGPVVTRKMQQCFIIQSQWLAPNIDRKLVHKHRCQFKNVFAPFAKGRHFHTHNVHSMNQIASKFAICNGLFQIHIGCKHEPQIKRHITCRTDRTHFIVLKHPQ